MIAEIIILIFRKWHGSSATATLSFAVHASRKKRTRFLEKKQHKKPWKCQRDTTACSLAAATRGSEPVPNLSNQIVPISPKPTYSPLSLSLWGLNLILRPELQSQSQTQILLSRSIFQSQSTIFSTQQSESLDCRLISCRLQAYP